MPFSLPRFRQMLTADWYTWCCQTGDYGGFIYFAQQVGRLSRTISIREYDA